MAFPKLGLQFLWSKFCYLNNVHRNGIHCLFFTIMISFSATQTPKSMGMGPDYKTEKALKGELSRMKARVEALQQQNKELRLMKEKFNNKRKTIVKEELMKSTGIAEEQLNQMVNKNHRVKSWSVKSLVMPLIQQHISRPAYEFNVRTSLVPLPGNASLKYRLDFFAYPNLWI